MKINSINWHEINLKNMMESRARMMRELNNKKLTVEQLEKDIDFLANQINEAKRLGKESFDPGRFMKRSK